MASFEIEKDRPATLTYFRPVIPVRTLCQSWEYCLAVRADASRNWADSNRLVLRVASTRLTHNQGCRQHDLGRNRFGPGPNLLYPIDE
jgi:hypothetical protein